MEFIPHAPDERRLPCYRELDDGLGLAENEHSGKRLTALRMRREIQAKIVSR